MQRSSTSPGRNGVASGEVLPWGAVDLKCEAPCCAPDQETSVRADGNGKHCRLPQSGPRSREQRLQEPEIETSGPPYHPVYGHLVEILVSVGDFRPKRLLAVEEGEANGRRFPRESSIVYSRRCV